MPGEFAVPSAFCTYDGLDTVPVWKVPGFEMVNEHWPLLFEELVVVGALVLVVVAVVVVVVGAVVTVGLKEF